MKGKLQCLEQENRLRRRFNYLVVIFNQSNDEELFILKLPFLYIIHI